MYSSATSRQCLGMCFDDFTDSCDWRGRQLRLRQALHRHLLLAISHASHTTTASFFLCLALLYPLSCAGSPIDSGKINTHAPGVKCSITRERLVRYKVRTDYSIVDSKSVSKFAGDSLLQRVRAGRGSGRHGAVPTHKPSETTSIEVCVCAFEATYMYDAGVDSVV
jgi:hypothetical protein